MNSEIVFIDNELPFQGPIALSLKFLLTQFTPRLNFPINSSPDIQSTKLAEAISQMLNKNFTVMPQLAQIDQYMQDMYEFFSQEQNLTIIVAPLGLIKYIAGIFLQGNLAEDPGNIISIVRGPQGLYQKSYKDPRSDLLFSAMLLIKQEQEQETVEKSLAQNLKRKTQYQKKALVTISELYYVANLVVKQLEIAKLKGDSGNNQENQEKVGILRAKLREINTVCLRVKENQQKISKQIQVRENNPGLITNQALITMPKYVGQYMKFDVRYSADNSFLLYKITNTTFYELKYLRLKENKSGEDIQLIKMDDEQDFQEMEYIPLISPKDTIHMKSWTKYQILESHKVIEFQFYYLTNPISNIIYLGSVEILDIKKQGNNYRIQLKNNTPVIQQKVLFCVVGIGGMFYQEELTIPPAAKKPFTPKQQLQNPGPGSFIVIMKNGIEISPKFSLLN